MLFRSVKGHEYVYFQHLGPGGAKRQTYLGPRGAELDAVIERFSFERDSISLEQDSIQRLAALLRAGGAMITDAPSARVVRALADAGVFHAGGVVVGTHAFTVLGNMLGVRWDSAVRTQDVDIAAQSLDVAVPGIAADLPSALESLEMGFLPVPGLDPKSPSTSFKVRGQGLRVDLLTPSREGESQPVAIPRFAAAATPLRFLDYVIEAPVGAALVSGGVVAVNVPDAARFALHKLIVASERHSTAHMKREKDLTQAAQVLEVLFEDRPGDVAVAWDALQARGTAWVRRVESSLEALGRHSEVAAAQIGRAHV